MEIKKLKGHLRLFRNNKLDKKCKNANQLLGGQSETTTKTEKKWRNGDPKQHKYVRDQP